MVTGVCSKMRACVYKKYGAITVNFVVEVAGVAPASER